MRALVPLLAAGLPAAVVSVSSLADLDCTVEYVVIGSGCAGTVLAARLAQTGRCVALLERGEDDDYNGITTIGIPVNLSHPSTHWLAQPQFAPEIAETIWLDEAWDVSREWSTLDFTSTAPSDFAEWQMAFKLVGGGSSGNAMVYNRGASVIYDTWGPGWEAATVGQAFDQLEAILGPEFENSEHTAAPEAVVALEAALAAHPSWSEPTRGRDIADGDGSLVGFYEKSIKYGRRSSAASEFLTPALRARTNFVLLVQTEVRRILFEGKRAVGVQFSRKGGPPSEVLNASKEVILSAGPYNSPKLLMQSGVGPADHLAEHDIPLVADLPGVGENYRNHLFLPVVVNLKQPYSSTVLNPPPTSNGGDWIGHWYSARCLEEGCIAADMQTAWSYYAGYAHYLEPPYVVDALAPVREDPAFNGTANLWVMNTQPRATGKVRLRDRESEHPQVFANFLSDERDVAVMVEGVKAMRAVIAQAAHVMEEVPVSARAQTDQELAEYVHKYAMGQYHPSGTVKMGAASDPTAVVGYRLGVHGLQSLRVVDSSIMPWTTNGNPSAPSMMIGFRAADMILEDESLPCCPPASSRELLFSSLVCRPC